MRDGDGWSSLFSSAFTQSRNAMLLADAQRRHVDVNAAYLQLLGRRRAEVIGHRLADFVLDGPVISREEWARALASRRFPRPGGEGRGGKTTGPGPGGGAGR